MLNPISNLGDELHNAVGELQRLKHTSVPGDTAETFIPVPDIETEDKLLQIVDVETGQDLVAEGAHIVDRKATGAITISGDPLNGDTVTVNDKVFTFVTGTPTDLSQVPISPGDVTAMAAALARRINEWESRRLTSGEENFPRLIATPVAGQVDLKATFAGVGNGHTLGTGTGNIVVDNTDPGAPTATFTSAGDGDVFTLIGFFGANQSQASVVFTIKATPTDPDVHVPLKATDAEQAAEAARVISTLSNKYGIIFAKATSLGNVMTVLADAPRTGNSITLSESATNVAVSGSGYLAGGSALRGLTLDTDTSGKNLLVLWYDKNP